MKTNLGDDCVLMCALCCIVACFSLLMIVSKHLPKKLCPNGWMLDVGCCCDGCWYDGELTGALEDIHTEKTEYVLAYFWISSKISSRNRGGYLHDTRCVKKIEKYYKHMPAAWNTGLPLASDTASRVKTSGSRWGHYNWTKWSKETHHSLIVWFWLLKSVCSLCNLYSQCSSMQTEL